MYCFIIFLQLSPPFSYSGIQFSQDYLSQARMATSAPNLMELFVANTLCLLVMLMEQRDLQCHAKAHFLVNSFQDLSSSVLCTLSKSFSMGGARHFFTCWTYSFSLQVEYSLGMGGAGGLTYVRVLRNSIFPLAMNLWTFISLLGKDFTLCIFGVEAEAASRGRPLDDIALPCYPAFMSPVRPRPRVNSCQVRWCTSICHSSLDPFLEERGLFPSKSWFKTPPSRKLQELLGPRVSASCVSS